MVRRAARWGEDGTIGILITVLIIGVLATIAVVAVQRAGDSAGPSAGPPAGPAGLPGGAVVGTEPGAGVATPSARGVGGLVGGARTDECVTDARTIAAAAEAYQAARGAWPATVRDLAAAGLLATVPSVPGYTYTLDQAGRRVLVNGTAPDAGCAAPAGR
ncbi:MAG TPA: hypothetical protein VFJ85_01480 [Acidimicrobiales bacterium]|nr:hypothetical protein [Acidimicrobiales bacterium]